MLFPGALSSYVLPDFIPVIFIKGFAEFLCQLAGLPLICFLIRPCVTGKQDFGRNPGAIFRYIQMKKVIMMELLVFNST